MVAIVTGDEARAWDEDATKRGLEAFQLMEVAGAKAAQYVAKELHQDRVAVVVGSGHNGGDGLVVARYLARYWPVEVVFVHGYPRFAGAERLVASAQAFGAHIGPMWDMAVLESQDAGLSALRDVLARSTVIIDAVLGTGLHVPLKPWVKVVIAAINQAGRPVYALDLPSGVDTDNGQIDETAVRADATIALGGTKWGHWCYPGASYRGRLVLADIGLPDHPTAAHLIDSAFVSAALIPLAPDGHKYRRGRLVVVGGSADMPGAPQMAASAATRMGVGLVELMVPRSIVSRLSVSPAMLVHPIDEDENGSLCMTEVEKTHLTRAQAVVLGPGLGRQSAVEWLRWLQIHQKPIVIDADGLALLAAHPEVWDWPQAVLTPHEGEAAGLLGVSALEIRSDRLGALLSLLQRFNSTVVLKGAFTLLGSRQQVYVNPSGIPQLATAGSGDVLAGIIGALLASGYGTEAAAAIGVYIHGQAARLARLSHGDSLIAPDLIEALGSGWTDLVLAGNGGEESVVWI